MKKALLLAAVAVLIVVAIIVFAAEGTPTAPPPPGGPGIGGAGGFGGPMRQMGAQGAVGSTMPPVLFMLMNDANMNLTEEQRTSLDTLYKGRETTLKENNDKIRAALDALRKALLAETADDATISGLVKAAQKCETDIISENLTTWKSVRSILNADQIKIVTDKMKAPQSPRGGRGGPGGTPPTEAGAPPPPPPPGQ